MPAQPQQARRPDEPSSTAVTAVAINYDGGARILRTIAALRRQSYPPARIVVVDDGSTDGSFERIGATFPEVLRLRQPDNLGLSAARNRGLDAADTELVLMVDYDVYLEPDCLERMVATLHEESAAIVCPRIRLTPERHIVQAEGSAVHFVGTMILRHGYRPASALDGARREVDGCIGACMLFSREAVERHGRFCELLFMTFEDLEFTLRMRLAGHRIVCEPAAVAFHDRGDATPELSFRGQGDYPARRIFENVHNHLVVVLIHYAGRTLLVLSPALLLHEAATLAMSLARGRGASWRRAMGTLWRHRREIRRQRSLAQARRRLSDRQVLVGGPLPLAPGLLGTRSAALAAHALSAVLNVWWWLAGRWLG